MKQSYNNNSLAFLGHGKWKSALRHTLLIIGLVLGFGGMNVWAQDPIPAAVKLDKQFIPDDATGHSGKIILETYVTGKVTQVTASQPTDIVLVLDYSMSMNSSYPGASNRRAALEESVQGFVEAIQQDAETNGCEHRMAVVKFSSQSATSLLSVSGHPTWGNNNTPSFTQEQYQNALVVVNDNGNVNTRLSNTNLFDGVGLDNGTVMNAGMATAHQIFLARAQSGGGGTTFVVPNQTPTLTLPRNMVVVFFTDGYPTASHGASESTMHNYWQTSWDMHTVSNNTCQQAANIKAISITSGGQTVKPTIFSIGIHADCDPTISYQAEYHTRQRPDYPETGYYTGVECLNGLLHFISSDYDETLTSWVDNITTTGFRNEEHYLAPQDANDLIEAFGKITSASGSTPVNLGSQTVIQDIISPSFQLPEGTDVEDIIVYAPKVTRATGTEGNYVLTFADTTTVKVNNQVQFLTMNNGVVVDDDEKENRLNPNGLIEIGGTDGKQLTFTGFDFSKQFCGPTVEEGQIVGCEGRKLVIVFPIEIEEGVWGDGINTNSELSFVTPDGTIKYQFPMPNANVLGDVWTEIITTKPEDFDPMDIDSPEDLAWFISYVNGRAGYDTNDQIPSNPTANGKLTADIDMSAHNWVPIGSGWENANGVNTNTRLAYKGDFDGNGHVITGLKNNASKYYKKANTQGEKTIVVFPGMFADIDGGTVHDVFVLDADFRGKHHDEHFIHHGIIADTLTSGSIYNCEAAGRITTNNDTVWVKQNGEFVVTYPDKNLVFGGLVGLNEGTIYNSMAMPELTGYSMGGAVGENRGGSFSNGFTNGVYNYVGENGDNAKPVGGIAAENGGSISNCYVRFERNNQNLDKATFGMLYGSDEYTLGGTTYEGTDEYCYIPQIWTFSRPTTTSTTTETNINSTVPTSAAHPGQNPANSYTLSVTPTFYNMFTNDNMTGGSWGIWNGYNVYLNGTPLVDALNAHKGNGASWKRTTAGAYSTGAGDINEDYPVLQLPDYTCLGSADGIRIDYAHNLNDMLHRHNNGKLNENTQISNGYTQNNANFYKKTAHTAIYKGTINLFDNDDVTLDEQPSGKDGEVADNCTAEGVVVYIDENISLLQDDNSSIEAYTGQTLKAFDNTATQEGERWHNISSSLSNSQFGWTYENYSAHNWDANPCGWTLPNTDEDHAFFPVDIFSYHRAEFYCFLERAYHWINFRRRSDSHWHMDNYELNIPYPEQEDHFLPGKGYLSNVDMSMWWSRTINGTTVSKRAQFLQNRGTLNNSDVEIDVTYTADNEWTGLAGYNLLGNPYQSFLDFDAFVTENATLLSKSNFANTYAVYDPESGKYIQYLSGSSKGSRAAGRYLNMHQGFFIQVNEGGTATFTNDMRTNDAEPNFRGEQPAYPLINFILTDKGGNNDLAILELNRPENDGARKLRVGNSTGRIYFRYDNENLAIYFRNSDKDYQSLNFAAEEDGNFTLSWERANDNFNSLTLVDNVTGIKTDMLTHDHYTFEGRVSDYNSRFKIVFGEMDTNEEEPVLEHFAFFDHGNLIVNGTGHFEVIDVLGRVVYNAELTDTQNTVSLPSNVRGVCMLCFTRNNETKVQKMVIQ